MVNLYSPPYGGQWFYFKMTSDSDVTPCFTIAVYADNQDNAQKIAEAQNGGYDADAIDLQDFDTACD